MASTKQTFKALAAVLLTALAGSCAAQVIGAHIGTAHEKAGFNDANPGVYVRLANGATLGTYYNSIRSLSAYAGYTLQQADGPFAVSFLAITGYRLPVLPAVIPSARIAVTEQVGLRVSLLLQPDSGSGLHFSIETKF